MEWSVQSVKSVKWMMMIDVQSVAVEVLVQALIQALIHAVVLVQAASVQWLTYQSVPAMVTRTVTNV